MPQDVLNFLATANSAPLAMRELFFCLGHRVELRVLTSADGQSAENTVLPWERVAA